MNGTKKKIAKNAKTAEFPERQRLQTCKDFNEYEECMNCQKGYD